MGNGGRLQPYKKNKKKSRGNNGEYQYQGNNATEKYRRI